MYICTRILIWTNMTKITLNVAGRIILLLNLPEQGSVVEMIAKRNVRKKIDFSSEEVEKLDIKTDSEGRINWNPTADTFDFEFNDREVDLLKKIIKKLDESGNITDSILDLATELNGDEVEEVKVEDKD